MISFSNPDSERNRMTEQFWAIRNCDLFSRLTEMECARIETNSRLRTWAKGSPIYLPAQAADHVFLLATGRVKLSSVTPDGKQAILGFIEPGDLFGELAAFDSSVREEMATAIKNSTLVMIPAKTFESLMESSPKFTLSISKLMGLRRKKIERRLRYLLFRSSRDRLIQLLIELFDEAETSTKNQDRSIRLSHHDLACLIGSTRETVTATLGELQVSGLVELNRQKIAILDRKGLLDLAKISEEETSHNDRSRRESLKRQDIKSVNLLRSELP